MPPIKKGPMPKAVDYDLKAFITGSHAYGTPKKNSDIDLVVFISEEDLKALEKFAASVANLSSDREIEGTLRLQEVRDDYVGSGGTSFRFGGLNLLCVTDPIRYGVWLVGTALLKTQAPVDRETAVNTFAELREEAGLTKGGNLDAAL